MSKKLPKDWLQEHVNFLEAERRALVVLDLLVVRGVITLEQRNEHLADATQAVLKDRYWVRVRAKANAMVSNEESVVIAETKKAAFNGWLKNHLHHYQTGEEAIDAAILDKVVAWGRHRMRREISAFRKAQRPEG